jgi:hypothetical protein
MDLNFTLTSEQFILNGHIFEFKVGFEKCNTVISILSYVKKEEANSYYLYIKGNYPRGRCSKIELSRPSVNLSADKMHYSAKLYMNEYIPIMITKDYPASLKKVAKDNKVVEDNKVAEDN